MIQSTDQDRLSSEENSRVGTCISMGRGIRYNFGSRLGVVGDRNRRFQVGGVWMNGESTWRDTWNWWGGTWEIM